MWKKVQQTTGYLKQRTNSTMPEFGIILGSGLGSFVHDIEIEHKIPYSEIPNFPISTVEGHQGSLVFGKIGEKNVIAMQGRFHYYEGYSMQEVTFPIRVMKCLGIQNLIVSNASGGVNYNYQVGDLIIIYDHINMMPEHPLRGRNENEFGPRFVNMGEPYNRKLIEKAKQIAIKENIVVKEGVYCGLQGPTFETLAEYKMVRILGADCVGMSTVPEVIVARHMGLSCFGFSIISDMGIDDQMDKISHQEVLKAVKKAEPNAKKLIKELILQTPNE